MVNQAIVFDFDGTIADSFLLTIKILFSIKHQEPLPDEDISRLRNMNLAELLDELKVPWWRAFFLDKQVRRLMHRHMREVMLVPGIDTTLNKLQEKHKLFILSSNSASNVQAFLHRFEIDSYFMDIYGDVNPFHKKRKLETLISRHNLSFEHTWYVGDEMEDIQAAQQANIKSVAVTWGYSNIHMLKSRHPDALVFTPDELEVLFCKQ